MFDFCRLMVTRVVFVCVVCKGVYVCIYGLNSACIVVLLDCRINVAIDGETLLILLLINHL